MVPTAPPPLAVPGALRVTVFPDAVVVVVVVVGREVVGRDVDVLRGVDAAGAGVAAGVAGTSRSCGCAAVSWLARLRSRLRAESAASEVSLLLSFTVHAATASATPSASG